MEKRKIISIILGILIISVTITMPFYLKQLCYEHFIHQEWSFGAWNAVFISSVFYGVIIGILTIVLVLINVLKIKKNGSE